MDYCSSIWSYKNPVKLEQVQNQAIRCFVGLMKTATTCAYQFDMNWMHVQNRHKINRIRFWNRLIKMPRNRLTYQAFEQKRQLCKQNWCEQTKSILCENGLRENYDKLLPVNIKQFQTQIMNRQNAT